MDLGHFQNERLIHDSRSTGLRDLRKTMEKICLNLEEQETKAIQDIVTKDKILENNATVNTLDAVCAQVENIHIIHQQQLQKKKQKRKRTGLQSFIRKREKFRKHMNDRVQSQLNQLLEYYMYQKPPDDPVIRIVCKETCYANAIKKYIELKEKKFDLSQFREPQEETKNLCLNSGAHENKVIQDIVTEHEASENSATASCSLMLTSQSSPKTREKMKVSTAIVTWLKQSNNGTISQEEGAI